MLQNFIEKFLIEKVGKFVEGFTKENLDLGLWGGSIVLKNLKLKPELLLRPAIPFRLIYSHIGLLSINLPWTKLSSESVQIHIEDLYLVIAPLDAPAWEAVAEYDAIRRVRELEHFMTHYVDKVSKKDKKKKKPEGEDVTKVSMPKENEEKKTNEAEEENKGFFARIGIKVRENSKVNLISLNVD